MMKTRRLFMTVFVLGLCIACASARAFAWSPYAHSTTSQGYSSWCLNLPDLWDSKTSLWDVGNVQVTAKFGWSHACLRTGRTGWVPNKPTQYGVPAGIEKPGEDMYHIYKNKLLVPMSGMLRTAQGFVGHNVGDKKVHFTFFLGNSAFEWGYHHVLKESWADYCLIARDAQLAGQIPWRPFPTYVYNMRCKGDAGMINLAQKVFRKNRQTVDQVPAISGQKETINVMTRNAIAAKIRQLDTKLRTRRWHQSTYLYYKDEEAITLSDPLIADWSLSQMFTLHLQSTQAVQSALNNMP